MGLFSDHIERAAQRRLDHDQRVASGLFTGWLSVTQQAKNQKDAIKQLNDALKLVDGLKTNHTSPAKFYHQNISSSDQQIGVYYCKATNTIKAINY